MREIRPLTVRCKTLYATRTNILIINNNWSIAYNLKMNALLVRRIVHLKHGLAYCNIVIDLVWIVNIKTYQ